MRNLSITAFIILVIGILLVIFSPYLFTRPGNLSFNDTGEIGDTIGGITAPITSLIGSILVFFALRAQVVANEIIQGQIRQQRIDDQLKKEVAHISDLYKYFINSIDVFEYDRENGKGAVIKLMNNLVNLERKVAHDDDLLHQGKIAELYGLLRLSKLFLEQLLKSKIDKEDRVYFKELIKHHLDSLILPYFTKSSNKPPCEECGEMHNGIPNKLKKFFAHIEELLNKT